MAAPYRAFLTNALAEGGDHTTGGAATSAKVARKRSFSALTADGDRDTLAENGRVTTPRRSSPRYTSSVAAPSGR